MNWRFSTNVLLLSFLVFTRFLHGSGPPIRLHPDNPHYFLWRDQPTVLITAGEHYGAALNRSFDYVRYLDELKKHNFNLTRVFSGTYRELPGTFNITGNTLAPPEDKFLCPWSRVSAVGKFDLTKWDSTYFARVKDLLQKAGERGIVVELVLFCTMYDDTLWHASPMNIRNNVNGAGDVSRAQVFDGADKKLLAIQTELARKLATELNGFDNLYFEICNEPYERGGLTRDWNDKIATAIVEAESTLPNKHLIAQGFPPVNEPIRDLNPNISILNFHATSSKSVRFNYHLNKAIAFDETGGEQSDRRYRVDGWDFIVGGGAVYDHLDFSFTTSQPDGSAFPLPAGTPGGGGPEIRRQLQILKRFIESFDFIPMKPADDVIKTPAQSGQAIRVLAENGKAYALHIAGGASARFDMELPAGNYNAEWLNTKSGKIEKTDRFAHQSGLKQFNSPAFSDDIALKVIRSSAP
jgi:hypothetical protein